MPDVAINAVFLALFIAAAAGHMGLFKYNQNKKGKKFVFNAMVFGMSRSDEIFPLASPY